MIALGKNHPSYIPSAILSKYIWNFHHETASLKPFLKEKYGKIFHEINSEEPLDVVFKTVSSLVEPTVIHFRVGSNNDLRDEMISQLVSKGYMNLEVNELIWNETEWRTSLGQDLLTIISAGKIIPSILIVWMLWKIIYSGQRNTKFILSYFPDIIEHVHEFEKHVGTISAVFFTTREGELEVELKNNQLTLFTIDSLFQKQYWLWIVNKWDETRFNEMMGSKINYGILTGKWLSGKTSICKHYAQKGMTIIDHKAIHDDIKKSYEELPEPPETVPMEAITEKIKEKIKH